MHRHSRSRIETGQHYHIFTGNRMQSDRKPAVGLRTLAFGHCLFPAAPQDVGRKPPQLLPLVNDGIWFFACPWLRFRKSREPSSQYVGHGLDCQPE